MILSALEGRKTYILAFIGASVALAQAFGVVLPDWTMPILGFLGLGTLRAAVR